MNKVFVTECTHVRVVDSENSFVPFLLQIAAACEFYMYVGHIQKGILKRDDRKL